MSDEALAILRELVSDPDAALTIGDPSGIVECEHCSYGTNPGRPVYLLRRFTHAPTCPIRRGREYLAMLVREG